MRSVSQSVTYLQGRRPRLGLPGLQGLRGLPGLRKAGHWPPGDRLQRRRGDRRPRGGRKPGGLPGGGGHSLEGQRGDAQPVPAGFHGEEARVEGGQARGGQTEGRRLRPGAGPAPAQPPCGRGLGQESRECRDPPPWSLSWSLSSENT
jgi:hypothetical protein